MGDLFAGALIPGIGLAFLYMLYQFLVGIIKPEYAPALPVEEGEDLSLLPLLATLTPPILLIVSVLGSILMGIATPTEAAGVGALGAFLLAGKRLFRMSHQNSTALPAALNWFIIASILAAFALPILRSMADLRLTLDVVTPYNSVFIALASAASMALLLGAIASVYVLYRLNLLKHILSDSMRVSTLAFAILIGATIFSLIFRSLGGEEVVTHVMENIPGGPMGALLAVSLLVFILGFFLDFIEIVFIIMPIVAPVILQSDINPVWFGVLIAMNLQTSFLTPPF